MDIKKLRLQKAWSQEQLAECTGLSVRTIQRLENGSEMSLESRKAIAAVFDINVIDLNAEEKPGAMEQQTSAEQQAMEEVRHLKRFYLKLIRYGLIMLLLLAINLIVSPHNLWVVWPALGWGLFLLVKGLGLFFTVRPFGLEWEKRQINKRLG
jgi:transcriptional regulator with XRE-family HTH domain